MWHIIATVCFVNLTAVDMACFSNAFFPTPYKTQEECVEVAQSLAALLDEDFQKLQVRGAFSCINKKPLVLPPTYPEEWLKDSKPS